MSVILNYVNIYIHVMQVEIKYEDPTDTILRKLTVF